MKIFVNGTKYLSIILLLTGLTVRVVDAGDCNITEIIEKQDKVEKELMKDAFWSLEGKPYPNMQNPTVAYVHFAHCRKIQKDKIYEKSEETLKQLKLAYGSDENKKVFDAQSDEDDAAKARIKMEKKHFKHCNKLLIKTEKSKLQRKFLQKLLITIKRKRLIIVSISSPFPTLQKLVGISATFIIFIIPFLFPKAQLKKLALKVLQLIILENTS